MAAVEDGEILELDNDQVIDLCSDPEPSPRLVQQSQPSSVTPSHLSFRQNTYRGGDPFLAARPHDHLPNPSVAFPSLRHSPLPFHHPHTPNPSITDINPQLHSPPPDEPMFKRDPYAPNNNTSPSHPSVSSLPALPPSHELSWSPHAPPNAPPMPFRPPCEPQVPDSQPYDHDPGRFSPVRDQQPVYHAEPAPPPSVFYAMQHPAVSPVNAGPRRSPFDILHTPKVPTIHQSQEPPHQMFNQEVYTARVANGHVYPVHEVLNPLNGFSNVVQPYQGMHETQSPRHRVTETQIREEEHVQHGERSEALASDAISTDPDAYSQQYLLSAHQRHISETLVTEGVNHDRKGGENRKRVESRISYFSDEEDQRMNPAVSGDSPGRHRGEYRPTKHGAHDMYQPKASEENNQNRRPPSQDQASEGEIDSTRMASPVTSLATAPDETPSPPSTKKKPANFDTRKHLSELRRKALMSVKKRPAARRSDDSIEPNSPPANPHPAAAISVENVDGQQREQGAQGRSHENADHKGSGSGPRDGPSTSNDKLATGFRLQTDTAMQIVVGGVRRTMTRKQFAEWQAWPYQNRVLVDYSSDSDKSDASDVDNYSGDDVPNTSGEVRRSTYRDREEEIEAMKIRMIRLGKCPSMLFGGTNSSSGTKNSSSSLSTGNAEDKSLPAKDDKETIKNSALSKAQNAGPVTPRTEDPGKEPSDSELVSSPNQSDTPELEISLLDAAQEQSTSAVEKLNGTELTPISPQKASPISLSENRTSSESLKGSKQVSCDTGGTTRSIPAQDDMACSEEQNEVGGNFTKDTITPVQAPLSAASLTAASPIVELKRRIAAIEKSRDLLKQQRSKKQKISLNPEMRATDRTRADIEHIPKKTERGTAHGNNTVSQRGLRPAKRYYSSKASGVIDKNNQGLLIHVRKNEDVDIDMEFQESSSNATETKTLSNENQAKETALRLPDDKAERRYIDDLKLELEQKTKELMNERDRTEQLRTAEIAIAEAQAKLSFTRSRVSALRDELRKAEGDVLDAEKECQQRERVVAQLRFGNTDSSSGMGSRQEDPTGRLQVRESQGNDALGATPEIAIETDQEEGKGQEQEKVADFVLRPSPYSPSVGDSFISCLRALRAYILRIPHHSKARDRIAGGILSSTWGIDLDPMKAICAQELRGQCSNKACEFQHLKVFKAPRERALQVIHVIETFFSKEDKLKEEKSIINARIAIHEGKDATKTLCSLISTLCASSKAIPYSRVAD